MNSAEKAASKREIFRFIMIRKGEKKNKLLTLPLSEYILLLQKNSDCKAPAVTCPYYYSGYSCLHVTPAYSMVTAQILYDV
jgi:hypothetical protein